MKVEEVRNKQKNIDKFGKMVVQMPKGNFGEAQRLDIVVSENGLYIYKTPYILSDDLAKELRDWLCELYGLPKEK